MEKSALQLYVAAVQSGKQSDGGFKIDVHRLIARDLAAEFPGIPFTGEKLRSKCNQGFKKWYDAFLACKDASGFGWNEQHNMVTASEESHPAARRFKNTPFPEYHKLFIIFGGHSATGALHRGIDGEGENNLDVTEEQTGPDAPDGVLGDDKNERSGAKGTTSGSQQAGVRPRRRHHLSPGDRFENSIKRLITAFASKFHGRSRSLRPTLSWPFATKFTNGLDALTDQNIQQ
ncbi:hypothetical protein PSTG_15947 [Puccinia striiformis f. sp. tritici PST-78]|uniref:Myb/SANT-like domain-containing protein n=1 Tax=Puccinia striiformis f. sp. tritici PST-78 TaxID=1165861 RepID=A0A0L0UV52_9BASI|nr:hypothetical protein PSTG_15947 [Puccinia striiformis f. sp. tritici PST-78]